MNPRTRDGLRSPFLLPELPKAEAIGPGRTASCGAFSLVEVVVAIGIFAFAAVSLLGLATMALRTSHRADTQSACATIVSTEMGKLSSQKFATNVASMPFTDYFTIDGTSTNQNSANSSAVYRCIVTDASLASDATNYMHRVSLVISWPNPVFNRTNAVVGSFMNYGQ